MPKLPNADYVKKLLAAVEAHPFGALLMSVLVVAIVYVWKH
jgi:hypothetical protein